MTEPAVLQYPPVPYQPVAENKALTVWGRFQQWARGLPEPQTSPDRLQVFPSGSITIVGQRAPLSWVSNAQTYRAWSLTPWVRTAIKIRREQIAAADWDIVQYDREGRQSKALSRRIRDLIDTPNARSDSFHSFAQELLEDLLVLDGAAVEKVRYPDGEIAQLWPTPGEFIAVDPRWDGSDAERTRYFYIPDGQVRAEFTNANMMYMVDNPRTVSAIGISPIEVLKTVIDSELQNQHYNRRQVLGAAPDGILDLGENALEGDVQRTRGEWDQRVAEGGAVQIVGGFKGLAWHGFRDSNRNMQFVEWEDLLLRCIASVYSLSPMDLGITFDVNRSTAGIQQENTEDRGLRPLLDLFQRYLTRNIVWDEKFGGRENNLAFRFSALNLNETKQKADINKIALGGAPWKTVNEARLMDGRTPIGELSDETNIFNHVLLMTPKGMLDLTEEKYVGEQQLMELGLDAQTTAITAQANADKEVAAAAPKPVVVAPAKAPAKKPAAPAK
jgi:phage portal protein BeeE